MSQDKSFLTIHWALHCSVVTLSSLHTTLHLVTRDLFHLDKAEQPWDTCRFHAPCLYIFLGGGGSLTTLTPSSCFVTLQTAHPLLSLVSGPMASFWPRVSHLVRWRALFAVFSERFQRFFKHPSKLQKLPEYHLSTITAVKYWETCNRLGKYDVLQRPKHSPNSWIFYSPISSLLKEMRLICSHCPWLHHYLYKPLQILDKLGNLVGNVSHISEKQVAKTCFFFPP